MSLKAKAAIDAAFIRLTRATESRHEASVLLHAALDAAIAGEKGHRRMGRSFGGQYAASVQTAARYFVCKWFNTPARVSSARDACSMRGDCLNASALRELCDSEGIAVDMDGISDLDYSRDLVGES